ncbi:MAG: hypothetical protein NVS1B11_14030 [Terriglobales bacterium]
MRAFENWVSGALVLLLPLAGLAQPPSAPPTVSPNELVRRVIANELKPMEDRTGWVYDADKEEGGKRQTKRVVQTRQGSLERLIAIDGQTLTPDQQGEESERIERIVSHPRDRQKLEQDQKKDAEQCESFFKMIPDAFLFTIQEQKGNYVKLSFKPNPKFQSSSREARVLHVMEGELLVHAKDERLVSISGHLTDEVKFGGGLLGYLDKGGTFTVKREEVAPAQWMMTSMDVHMNGKALFIKTIAVQQKESRHNFQELTQDVTLADAANILNNRIVLAKK